jgi:hypothetical protein
MKKILITAAISFVAGWFVGGVMQKSADEKDFSRRALTGISVDCYDKQGNLVRRPVAKNGFDWSKYLRSRVDPDRQRESIRIHRSPGLTLSRELASPSTHG